MRHRKKINHLGRKAPHRKAMLSNMASSLIMNKRIFTTLAKAKALRVYVEPLITKSKEDSTHSRRTVFSYLQDKQAVSELFREISQKIADRPGGYTRILKTGFRKGDAAEMCFIELVDYNPNMLKTAEDETKKTRRSRRGKKSADTTAEKPGAAPVAEVTTPEQPEAEVKEEVKAEAPVEETTPEQPEADVKEEKKTETPAAEETSETPEASKEKEEDNKKKEE